MSISKCLCELYRTYDNISIVHVNMAEIQNWNEERENNISQCLYELDRTSNTHKHCPCEHGVMAEIQTWNEERENSGPWKN